MQLKKFREYEYSGIYREMEQFESDVNDLIRRHNDAVNDEEFDYAKSLEEDIDEIDKEANKLLERIRASEAA